MDVVVVVVVWCMIGVVFLIFRVMANLTNVRFRRRHGSQTSRVVILAEDWIIVVGVSVNVSVCVVGVKEEWEIFVVERNGCVVLILLFRTIGNVKVVFVDATHSCCRLMLAC